MNFYERAGVEPLGKLTRTHFTADITASLDGSEVVLFGWVHILRDKGKIKFLVLRDERGTAQVTIPEKKVTADVFETAAGLKPEMAVAVKGKVVATTQLEAGAEVIPTHIMIINTSDRLPIDVVEGKVDIDLDTLG